MLTRICEECNEEKPIEKFPKEFRGDNTFYIRKKCKSCRAKASYSKNKENQQNKHYIRPTYNLTPEQFAEIAKEQNNKCPICGTDFSLLKRRPDIDHCHKTGRIRGLLCSTHNMALGQFQDNKEFLRSAIIYLEKYEI